MANESLVTVGAVLLILGVVASLVGPLCAIGIPLAIVGFILLIIGAVAESPRTTQIVYPAPYAPAPMATAYRCPRCGNSLTYVPQYQRWYCPTENVYPWG